MEKYGVWRKLNQDLYSLTEYNDESFFVLSLFLEDGLGFEDSINFLENKSGKKFCANISVMEKYNDLVTVTLDDTIFPDAMQFVTPINNLLFILKKWHYYKRLLVDTIKVVLKDDQVQVIDSRGSISVKSIQKIVYKWDKKNHIYSILTCEGETAYLLERFLAYCNSKAVDLYIKWALNPNEYYITQKFTTLEKNENYILISSTLTDKQEKPFFKISDSDFLSLLEKWKTFSEIGAHEITIIDEDGEVKIDVVK